MVILISSSSRILEGFFLVPESEEVWIFREVAAEIVSAVEMSLSWRKNKSSSFLGMILRVPGWLRTMFSFPKNNIFACVGRYVCLF